MEPHLIGDLLEDLDSLILHLALNRVEKLVEASSQPKHSSKGLLCLFGSRNHLLPRSRHAEAK